MESFDWVLLGLRMWLGVVMIRHGLGHAKNIDGTASWFASVGFRRARTQALASAAGELAMGAGVLLGLLTPFAAAGVAATMLVAFWSIHRFAGFFVYARPDEGYEYVATLAALAAALAILGPGAASLDAVVGIDGTFVGGVGALIVAGGLVAGAGQLAATWRKPPPPTE